MTFGDRSSPLRGEVGKCGIGAIEPSSRVYLSVYCCPTSKPRCDHFLIEDWRAPRLRKINWSSGSLRLRFNSVSSLYERAPLMWAALLASAFGLSDALAAY